MTTVTADQIASALWMHFATQSWSGIAEVQAPIPEGSTDTKARRIDLLLLRDPRRLGIDPVERLAVEIKVSRQDFLNDIRHPEKQAPWRALAHRHVYAVPHGLVRKEEVPRESGLVYVESTVDRQGKPLRIVTQPKVAPFNDTIDPAVPPWLMLALAQRASWAEARAKGWTWQPEGHDIGALRLEADRLRKDLSNATNRAVRAEEARDAYRRVASAATTIPCNHCGKPIVPRTFSSRNGLGWKHVDKEHDGPCVEFQRLVSPQGFLAAIRPADDFDPAQAVTA